MRAAVVGAVPPAGQATDGVGVVAATPVTGSTVRCMKPA